MKLSYITIPLVHLLFSCPIRADLISIDGGIHHHHAISIIIPLAVMVLHPALGCLRINDGFDEPAQGGSGFCAGGSCLWVESVSVFSRKDSGLLCGVDRCSSRAADLSLICEGHRLVGGGQVIAHRLCVVCRDDCQLFAGHACVRCKGDFVAGTDNACACRAA